MNNGPLLHEAAEPIGLVQRCRRCGLILQEHVNGMVPDGSPPPGYWRDGALVMVEGVNPRHMSVLSVTEPAPELCTRATPSEREELLRGHYARQDGKRHQGAVWAARKRLEEILDDPDATSFHEETRRTRSLIDYLTEVLNGE